MLFGGVSRGVSSQSGWTFHRGVFFGMAADHERAVARVSSLVWPSGRSSIITIVSTRKVVSTG